MTDQPQTADLPLFYNEVQALDVSRHANLGINPNARTYRFAKDDNAIAINASEFERASKSYPIVFIGQDKMLPVAIFGLKAKGGNLFISSDGGWNEDTYIPEYARRYPFIFAQVPGGKDMALCVDMSDEVVQQNAPEPFFDGQDASTLTQRAMEFCKVFHEQLIATENMTKFLNEHGLLTTRKAEMAAPNGQVVPVAEFFAVDEERFDNLDDDVLVEMKRRKYLRPICAHLASLTNFERIVNRLGGVQALAQTAS